MELVTLPLWFIVDWCAPVWEKHGRSLSFKFMMRLLVIEKMCYHMES